MPASPPLAMPRAGRSERAESDRLLRRYAAHRDPADLEELVRAFRPLVRKLALRYARGSEPLDDLEQVGSYALVKAIQRFDPDRGYAFTSFAVPTILGELKRSFRDTAWSAHVPRSIQERVAEVRMASDEHAARFGHAPTVGELARRLDCDEELVVEALQAGGALSPLSLDRSAHSEDEEGDAALVERLGDRDAGYELVENRVAIEAALPLLSGPERQVLELRVGEELKQSEIAQRLGCSQMQVSRTLRSALDRLGRVTRHQSELRLPEPGR